MVGNHLHLTGKLVLQNFIFAHVAFNYCHNGLLKMISKHISKCSAFANFVSNRDAASSYLRKAGEVHGSVEIHISIGKNNQDLDVPLTSFS